MYKRQRVIFAPVGHPEITCRLHREGVKVVYDNGWSDDLSIDDFKAFLPEIDVYTPNDKEAMKLAGTGDLEEAVRFLACYTPHPIVTLGKGGCAVWQEMCIRDSSYIADENYDMSVYAQGRVDAFTVDGQEYALPKGLDSVAVALNTGLFEKYGVELPQDGWTWDDMRSVATELKDAIAAAGGSEYPIVMELDSQPSWMNFLYQNGGSYLSEDGTVSYTHLLGDGNRYGLRGCFVCSSVNKSTTCCGSANVRMKFLVFGGLTTSSPLMRFTCFVMESVQFSMSKSDQSFPCT